MPLFEINVGNIAKIRELVVAGHDPLKIINSAFNATKGKIVESPELAGDIVKMEQELSNLGIIMSAADKDRAKELLIEFALQILNGMLELTVDLLNTHDDAAILVQLEAKIPGYKETGADLCNAFIKELVASTPVPTPAPDASTEKEKRAASVAKARQAMSNRSKFKA